MDQHRRPPALVALHFFLKKVVEPTAGVLLIDTIVVVWAVVFSQDYRFGLGAADQLGDPAAVRADYPIKDDESARIDQALLGCRFKQTVPKLLGEGRKVRP